MNSTPLRDLVRFLILTAAITGGLWLVLVVLKINIHEGTGLWIFGLATSGPSLAALILWLLGRRRRLSRGGQAVSAPWLWLPAAIVLGALPTVVANLIVDPSSAAEAFEQGGATMATFGGSFMFVVLFLIAGPVAEEFGWRGYAQPRIRQSRGIIATSAILGVVWAVWHVPLYFLPGTGQYETGLFTLTGLIFMVSCVPLSLVYLFVSERLGGRVWAAIAIHFSGNAIGAFLPSESVAVSVIQLAVTVLLALGVLAAQAARPGVPMCNQNIAVNPD